MSDPLFIQDPERYFEFLPQPFAFIQDLVYSLLDTAYDRLLVSEKEAAIQSGIRKLTYEPIKDVTISKDVCFIDIARVKVHLDEEDGVEHKTMLILATRLHLLYFPVSCSYMTQDPLFQFKLPCEYPIHDLYVLSSSNRYALLRCRDLSNRVEYHAITSKNSYTAFYIPEEDSKVVSVVENDSQIVLTCSENEDLFLLIFLFPISQWREVIQVILNSSQEDLEANSAKLINFTKPILLARINKPQPLHPSTFFHQCDLPYFSDPKSYMNGISHALTQEFFKNQAEHFNARRPGFTSTRITPSAVINPLYQPHCSSVLSESVGKKDLAVWWEGGTDLYVYSISSTAPKDIIVYPLAIMELAADICSSGVNDIGDIFLLGYKGCISVWRFPPRALIKFLTLDEVASDVSLITFLPNLSSNPNVQFICVAENKSHILEITPKKQTLTLIDQTSDPVLPAVRAISQLIISPFNHYLLMHLVNGEKVVRDIATTVSGVIALLPAVPTHDTLFRSYLHPTHRQLYSIVCDSESGSRRLVQYDLSSVVNKSIIPEIEDKPKPIPESRHSTKRGVFIPGTNSIKKTAMERVMTIYNNREATRKKAKEIWDNLEKDLPPTP